MKKISSLTLVLFLTACTQAQMALQAEWSAWEHVNELAAVECGGAPMTIEEYDNSYSSKNISKREKCEMKLIRENVQPVVASPIAFKEYMEDVKSNNRKFAKRQFSYEEWWSEQELAGSIYSQKVEQDMMPSHNAELQGWDNFAQSMQSSIEANRPTQTYCTTIGMSTNCTTY